MSDNEYDHNLNDEVYDEEPMDDEPLDLEEDMLPDESDPQRQMMMDANGHIDIINMANGEDVSNFIAFMDSLHSVI